MIKTVLIDDERAPRDTMRSQLATYVPSVEVVGEADSVQSGIAIIRETMPDLVFLDIELPIGSGFDILDATRDLKFQVIFVTAFSQYAIQAFKFAATAYLLKPLRITELVEAVERAFAVDHVVEAQQKLSVLAHNMHPGGQAHPRLVLPDLTGFSVVEVSTIVRCESERNYTRFHFTDQPSALITRTMKDYEDLLTSHGFCRIHQSHLINLAYVKRYIRGKGGEVEMSDKSILPVSRAKKDEFLQHFMME
jgi:two-component system, LytTR family, response regulator